MNNNNLIIAVPKGRILNELQPFFEKVGLILEADFYDKQSRSLKFSTNVANVFVIRVRSFDVPTFVANGAAHIGVAGSDVLEEFDYNDLYSPVDLNIGYCKLCVATTRDTDCDDSQLSHIRIATKYPNLTRKHFENKGIGVDIVKLNGAMELAPIMGLSRYIVDLVSSGETLKQNRLKQTETIMEITSRLIVNRTALKTRGGEVQGWIDKFAESVT